VLVILQDLNLAEFKHVTAYFNSTANVNFQKKKSLEFTVGILIFSEQLTLFRPAMTIGKRKKNTLGDLFSSVLLQSKKYHPSRNLKSNNLGIFQSLKLRNLMGKSLRISLKLNFTPNTLGCYGLNR